MKNIVFAGLLVALATSFAPLAASAQTPAPIDRSAMATGNPLDANAQMRDPSSYGSPSAGRMRTGMRGRSMMRNRTMMRNRMMMRRDMRRMTRDPSKFGGSTARRAR